MTLPVLQFAPLLRRGRVWVLSSVQAFARVAGMLLVGLFGGLLSVVEVSGVEPLFFGRGSASVAEECQEEEADDADTVICYGPADGKSPGTLFQWTGYATFEGGPPGLDEPLVTDRPDFTEASTTVGRGVAQLEMGYTYVYDNDGVAQIHAHSAPELLLRLGILADWLEARVAYNYTDQSSIPGGGPTSSSAGPQDLYLGFKIGLTPQVGVLPEMALMPQMNVPSGDPDLTAGEVLPGLNWLYGWDINDFLSTGGSSQFNRSLDEVTGNAYIEYAQSWTIGYRLTERLAAYTEWFVLIPDGADSAQTQHYFDGGFTFLVSNNIQLDIRGGVGASQAADDYFLGSGMSVRF